MPYTQGVLGFLQRAMVNRKSGSTRLGDRAGELADVFLSRFKSNYLDSPNRRKVAKDELHLP